MTAPTTPLHAPTIPPLERLSYTTDEAAQVMGISRTTLWRLVKRELIKPSRALRFPLFSRTEIERFLEATK